MHNMDSLNAFAMGQAHRHKESMVFDWNKAAHLIRENKANSASAGLRDDWEYTGGDILENGKPVSKDDTYTYLASTWATPELQMDGELIDCFKMQSEFKKFDLKASGEGWGARIKLS